MKKIQINFTFIVHALGAKISVLYTQFRICNNILKGLGKVSYDPWKENKFGEEKTRLTKTLKCSKSKMAGVGDHIEDVRNVVSKIRDKPKNQLGSWGPAGGEGLTPSGGKANRENNRTGSQDLEIRGEEARVELRKKPNIIIGIQFSRLGKTRT